MSCSRFQMDLSRCLDGRLPGARRAEVMTHVDKCSKCTQVWEDMQAAQSLVFRLEQPSVSPSFRDDVWERIHSGEGAPEILLQEPVTNLAKVRYGLIGAAAAAAFLVGLHLLTMDRSPVESDAKATDVVDLSDPLPDSEPTPAPRDIARPPEAPTTQLVSGELAAASQLATQTVARVSSAANRLKIRTPLILRGEAKNRRLWQEVTEDVQTIDGGLHVLDTLQRRQIVTLEPSSQECMTAARTTLDLFRSDPRRRTINLVRSLDNCSLDGLTKVRIQFSIPQIQHPQGVLMDILANDPRLGQILMDLGIIGGPVGGMMLPDFHFAPGPAQHLLMFRFRQMPQVPPRRASPEPTQPRKSPSRKTLRRRSKKN
jgi:Putative zinc-finger